MGIAERDMVAEEPLFESADRALRFAYQFSADQYDRPAMSKMGDKPHREGRGLGGLDGAAQAGLVLSAVNNLGRYSAAIVCCRYAVRMTPCPCKAPCCSGVRANPEFGDAVGVIANVLSESGVFTGCSQEPMLWRAIVSKFFGGSWKLKEMSQIFRISVDAASNHNSLIVRELRRDEPRAIAEVDARLKMGGLIR